MRWLLVALNASIVIAGWWLLSRSAINHDVASMLIGAEVLVRGGELYRDLYYFNPPLIFHLLMPAHWLADATGVSVPQAFQLLLAILVGASVASTHWLLGRLWSDPLDVRRWAWTSFLVLAVAWIPSSDAGQREHLHVLFIAPWLAASLVQIEGARLGPGIRAATAIAALVGFALKPFFVATWVGVEAVGAWQNRSWSWLWRSENRIIGAGLVLYSLVVVVAMPHYFNDVVPMALETYHAFNVPWSRVLERPELWWAVVSLVAAGVARWQGVRGAALLVLAVWVVAAMSSYLVQHKGWRYHMLPMLGASMVLLATAMGALVEKGGVRARAWAAVVALTLAVFCWPHLQHAATQYQGLRTRLVEGELADLITIFDLHAPGEKVMFFSDTGWTSARAHTHSRAIAHGHLPVVWPMPGLYHGRRASQSEPFYRDRAQVSETERRVREALELDLREGQPRLVLFPKSVRADRYAGAPFDWRAWALSDPGLRDALEAWCPLYETATHTIYLRAGGSDRGGEGRAAERCPSDAPVAWLGSQAQRQGLTGR